ncbi:MAG: hypothetical protein WBD31_32010 [Rubripirellula sp.]
MPLHEALRADINSLLDDLKNLRSDYPSYEGVLDRRGDPAQFVLRYHTRDEFDQDPDRLRPELSELKNLHKSQQKENTGAVALEIFSAEIVHRLKPLGVKFPPGATDGASVLAWAMPNEAADVLMLPMGLGVIPKIRVGIGAKAPISPFDAIRNKLIEVLHESAPKADSGCDASTAIRPLEADEKHNAESKSMFRLFNLYSDNVAEERMRAAHNILNGDGSINDKLEKIDAIFPIPASASGEALGRVFDVTRQAIAKTDWWEQNRKGKAEERVETRRSSHNSRAKRRDIRVDDDA